MTAAEEFLRGLAAAGGWADGAPEEPEPAETGDVAHPTCTCTPEEASL